MTWGREPPSLDWGMGIDRSPLLRFSPRECVFLPRASWTHRQLKGKHCYRSLSPAIFTMPFFFLKCEIISGCSWMHAVRAKWVEKPSHAGLCPSLSQAFAAGDSQSSRTLTVSQLCWGEVDGEGWMLGLSASEGTGCTLLIAHISALQPLKGSSSFSSIKLYFSYQKIWLDIYIHKHIYQHLYLYSASTTLGILQPQHTPFLSTSFG